MILVHDQIEFHNAAALEPRDGLPGLVPVRYPRAVREALNPGALLQSAAPSSVELRFVTAASTLRLTLAAHESDLIAQVYQGELGHSEHTIPAGTTRELALSAAERFSLVPPAQLAPKGGFAPAVWRVALNGRTGAYLGLDTLGEPVRPPRPDEKPRLRWLAYGSSITHSWTKGYPHQAARRLRVDVLNKGLSGSCHIEPQIADHFATGETWDFATLELGVNMRGGSFTPAEFERRARHLVDRLRAARPEAPIILITHLLNLDHHPLPDGVRPAITHQRAFDTLLRAIAQDHAADQVHLIEGTELLPDFSGLTCDLLHPSEYGHILIGENLARRLAPLIAPLNRHHGEPTPTGRADK